MDYLWMLFLFTLYPYVRTKDCVTIDACKCGFDDGSGIVDISTIGNQDGTALIQDAFAQDNYAYSYNPCYAFNEGTCANAAACQYDSANVIYYNIGDASNVAFSYDGLNVIATYTADDGQRTAVVTLVCDPNAETPTTQVSGEIATTQYGFQVTSKAACPTGSSGTVTVTVSISAGSVLVIVFFSVVIVYFLVGAMFMKFGRKMTGKEVVPNVGLWTAIPGLIKDGFGFVIGKTCRRGGYTQY